MSKTEYVWSHGRLIEVETVDPSPGRRRQAKFAKVDLSKTARAAEAMENPLMLIWPLLFFLAWDAKSPTFTLSNEVLARYGVNRRAKYRALARLARAGLIRVQYDGKRAATVTLLED
jgi:hypothetical protein